MKNTSKIYIEDDHIYYGCDTPIVNNRPIYHQCEDVQVYRVPSEYKHEFVHHRCGGDSMYLMTWFLPLSQQWTTKHICQLCLSHYIERYGNDKFIFE